MNKNSLEEIQGYLAEQVAKASEGKIGLEDISFTETPSIELGDFSLPLFGIAKNLSISPAEIAQNLAQKISEDKLIQKTAPAGPYLNFYLKREVVAQKVLTEVLENPEGYGHADLKSQEMVMLEYVSPNTNKPLHLGHIRNGLVGSAVSEILKTQGAEVFKNDIINDRGIHIIKSLFAYLKWGKGETPESTNTKGDHFVGKYYVLFNQEYNQEFLAWLKNKNLDFEKLSDPEKEKVKADFEKESLLMKQAHELLQKWESGDQDLQALWKKMNEWVYAGFEATYKNLGFNFDRHYYESEIYQKGKEIITEALEKGIFYQDETGAIVAPLSKHPEVWPIINGKQNPLNDKVVLRADGTGLYVTQDINLAMLRFEEYKITSSIYCVGSEQDYYFRQLFAIFKLLAFPNADKLYHLSYGMVYLPEGKMKSREGTIVDADELTQKMIDLAETSLQERYPDLEKAELKRRAEAIGLGALKFHILSISKDSPIYFDPKASLSFEGKTGPYLQYSYARAASILRKAEKFNLPEEFELKEDQEWKIVLRLLDFPKILTEASEDLDPAKLANYLIDLAQEFNTFYHHSSVLEAEEKIRSSRLALTQSFKSVLGQGILLLGFTPLEEM